MASKLFPYPLCHFLLLLPLCSLLTAQPTWHRRVIDKHRAEAHFHRHHQAGPDHHQYPGPVPLTKDGTGRDRLVVEFESKMALRDAIQQVLEMNDASLSTLELGRDFTNPKVSKRASDNVELQEKLNELNTALQSLLQLLAQDYGITLPSSTMSSSALPASTTAQTSESSSATAISSTPAFRSSAFDPMSSSNTAVYYSQTDLTASTSLTTLCTSPEIDIIILAFITTFSGPGGYPTLNLGPHCWPASSAQVAEGATGLIDCVADGFAAEVAACQNVYGKKVMLSLGGAKEYSNTYMESDDEAVAVAGLIWELFLGGAEDNETVRELRPFGEVVLDGIDIDNESGTTAHILTLMSTLRTYMTPPSSSSLSSDSSSSTKKPFFLSAAPQCPQPDASIPLSALQTLTDFVWIQFYNNPSCNLDTGAAFLQSLSSWSAELDGVQEMQIGGLELGGFREIGNGVTGGPRVFVGAPAFREAGSGFVENGQPWVEVVRAVQQLELPNLGGFMWWDGAYEVVSAAAAVGEEGGAGADGPRSYAELVKDVLG